MSAPQRRRPANPDTRRHVQELTSQEWGFGGWSNPGTTALAVYVIGVLLHLIGVSAWWVLLAGLVFTITFVVATMAKHTRVLGIAYAGTIAATITGWLTYAAGHTTFTVHDWASTRDHLLALAIGALPFGVVYGVLVRGRTEAEATAKAAEERLIGERKYWHEACAKAGIQKWYYVDKRATAGGTAVTMSIRPGGTPYGQALASLARLEVALQAPYPGSIRIERGSHAGEVTVFRNERNMLAELLPMPVDTSRRSITDPIGAGLFEDQDPAEVEYLYRSSLNIGQRDGGKSNYGNVRLLSFQRCDDVLHWVVDFKQGSVAKPYLAPYAAGQVERPAFDWVATTVGELEQMLDAADRIANGRAARRSGDKVRPSHRQPAIRLDIDEVADLTAGSETDPIKRRVTAKLIQLIRKHRSECVDVDLSTQRATMSFLGPWARDIGTQVTILITFKLSDPAEVYNTLGVDRARLGGVDPSTFEYSGTMLVDAPAMRKAPSKAYRVADDDPDNPRVIPDFVRQCAQYRPVLEPDAVNDAGPAYARRWHTDNARNLLVAAARAIGADFKPAHLSAGAADAEVSPLHRPTDSEQPTTAAPAPVPTAGGLPPLPPKPDRHKFRDRLIAQFGHDEGVKRWTRAEGHVALTAMKAIITDAGAGAMPTRELLSALAARDTDRWGDLNPNRLAKLLADFDLGSEQLGAGQGPWDGNPHGYRLAAIQHAIERGPIDRTA
ncbi:MAG TPA: hypothetical protein VGN37_11490 [Actinocatenispora sp.]